jgi:toxin ParE1/3/4
MRKVVYAASFKLDAEAIWDYIGAASPERADQLLSEIDRTIELLAEYPGMGKLRDELAPGVRSFLAARSYLVYYTVPEETTIVVLRLLHTSRDANRFFG